ncbi:MAG: caspase domain-containing protein [Leptolyngbyaceae cyanobacterium]
MTFEKGHALVIGVGTYQHTPKMNVPITVEDAKEVAAVLGDRRYCGYPEQQVTLLHDAEASRQNIEAALDQAATSLTETDTFLLFYSGHGEYGEDGYYLTTHDTQMDEGKKVVAGSGVHEKTLLEKIQAIKAKRVFLIFNACHAGEISPDSLGGEDEAEDTGQSLPDRTAAALLGTGEGRVIITACRETQHSIFMKKAALTFFAQALSDGLQGRAIQNRQGYISIFDLYEYVYTAVSEEVKRRFGMLGYAQEPELTIQKGVGVLAVALHRGQVAGKDLDERDRPTALGGAVREIEATESQQALQQILSGKVNFAAGGNIQDVQVLERGDYINAEGSQGFINRPSGPVKIQVGNSTEINTGGGDYAGRDVYKTAPISPTEKDFVSLQSLSKQVIHQIERAEAAGLDDLVDDLQGVDLALKAAIKAEANGKNDRRREKLSTAIQAIDTIATDYPQLTQLRALFQQAI